MNRKILFVVESLFEPGPVGQLKSIVRGLVENNYDVHLATTAGLHESSTDFFGPNVKLHSLVTAGRHSQKLSILRSVVSSISPQIVHAWGHRCHTLTLMATVGHKSRPVLTFLEIPVTTGSLRQYFDKLLRCRLINNSHSIQYVASHHTTKMELMENGFPESMAVIPNSVPDQRFDCQQSRRRLQELIGNENDQIYLAGTVARYDPKYRLKDLIWAIDLLCCVRQDIHLLVFGTGHGEDRMALRRFIGKTQSAQNVHLMSNDTALASDVAGLNFYWNSQLQEPNPSTMLAAMAHSIPVISVLESETSDVIVPLRTGLATNYGARDEFARWTKYLIEQPNSARQLGQQGKQHVENLFPFQTTVSEYLTLYTSIG